MITNSWHDLLAVDELPWSVLKIPNYVLFDGENIKFNLNNPPLIRGYFNGLQICSDNWILVKDDVCWMSSTPMELESQAPHLAAAKGHVVVMGAGMGLIIYNLLKKPEVTKVTIIENDPFIYRFLQSQHWEEWEGFVSKATVKLDDALKVKDLGDVDFLYADIWPMLGSEEALIDVTTMQTNINAEKVGYWGMEIDFINWCDKKDLYHPTMFHYKMWLHDIGLPLIGEETPEMTMWCLRAAHNVSQY